MTGATLEKRMRAALSMLCPNRSHAGVETIAGMPA
jgi:hypothetical protein